MAVDLYSFPACLGTLVINWKNRTTTFAGMDGDGGDELTVEQVQTTLVEHANNPDVTVWALVFWLENEQLAVHDDDSFAVELAHDREIKEDEEDP